MARRGRAGCVAAAALCAVVLLGSGCGAGQAAPRAVATRYLVIARAGNRRLNVDFDGLEHGDWSRFTPAQADLRDAAATEHLFDRRLLQIPFPPAIERVARSLYRVNQARARLTDAAAASPSLRVLDSYKHRLEAANRPVEQQVKTIRRQLGLPPPPSS